MHRQLPVIVMGPILSCFIALSTAFLVVVGSCPAFRSSHHQAPCSIISRGHSTVAGNPLVQRHWLAGKGDRTCGGKQVDCLVDTNTIPPQDRRIQKIQRALKSQVVGSWNVAQNPKYISQTGGSTSVEVEIPHSSLHGVPGQ